jgi:anti-anti-sigma factor
MKSDEVGMRRKKASPVPPVCQANLQSAIAKTNCIEDQQLQALPVPNAAHRVRGNDQIAFEQLEKEQRVPLTLEQSESQSVIRMEGAIDIASAGELKDLLLKALGSGKKEMCVSLDGVTSLDVTAVELLWAAEREATKAGVGFSFAGQAAPEAQAALAEAGLETFLVPSGAK